MQNFDAVVAATTIRANRSLYVDFITLQYTESGIGMVVRNQGLGYQFGDNFTFCITRY